MFLYEDETTIGMCLGWRKMTHTYNIVTQQMQIIQKSKRVWFENIYPHLSIAFSHLKTSLYVPSGNRG